MMSHQQVGLVISKIPSGKKMEHLAKVTKKSDASRIQVQNEQKNQNKK